MKKALKIGAMISLILIILGVLLFGIGFVAAGGEMKNLSYLKAEQGEYAERTEAPVSSVYLDFDNADVDVVFSAAAEGVTLSYPRLTTKRGKAASEIALTDLDGVLRLKERVIFKRTLFSFWTPDMKAVLTLPQREWLALEIKTDNGDIRLLGENGSVASLKINTDNGDVSLSNTVVCTGDVQIETDNGDIVIGDLQADTLRLETDNGDVTCKGYVQARKGNLETDNGGVYATNGVLDFQSATLETDNGNIKITLIGTKADYSLFVKTNNGASNVSDQSGGERDIKLFTDNGDITVTFAE